MFFTQRRAPWWWFFFPFLRCRPFFPFSVVFFHSADGVWWAYSRHCHASYISVRGGIMTLCSHFTGSLSVHRLWVCSLSVLVCSACVCVLGGVCVCCVLVPRSCNFHGNVSDGVGGLFGLTACTANRYNVTPQTEFASVVIMEPSPHSNTKVVDISTICNDASICNL